MSNLMAHFLGSSTSYLNQRRIETFWDTQEGVRVES